MERIKFETLEYARIEGVGLIRLATDFDKMTIHQAINAKSHMGGLPTRYQKNKAGVRGPEHMRAFISICRCAIDMYKSAPNRDGYLLPNCF
jgi:hypothetical protein